MAVYNGLPWLPVAAESVLGQTFTDFEFLIVDDGSTDGSGAWLDGLAAREPRVRVVHQPNARHANALNRGLAEARGAYVARLDADDLMYPERLAKQAAYLDRHPSVALVGSQVDWTAPMGTSRWHTPTDAHLARWTLPLENCFMHGGVMFRADAVRAVGGYDAAFEYTEDYDLWERLAARFDAVNLPETLAWLNQLRADNTSTVHAARQEGLAVAVMQRGIARYLGSAPSETVEDLYHLGRNGTWPGGAPPDARSRIAHASDMLNRFANAFDSAHAMPRASRDAVRADRELRLGRMRGALAATGGAGRLGRRAKPSRDTRGALLTRTARLVAP